jgi:hypothetical protein
VQAFCEARAGARLQASDGPLYSCAMCFAPVGEKRSHQVYSDATKDSEVFMSTDPAPDLISPGPESREYFLGSL